MRKYKRFFEFTETREGEEHIADNYNKSASPYQRKNYPAYITPYNPKPTENTKVRFIVWYSYK